MSNTGVTQVGETLVGETLVTGGRRRGTVRCRQDDTSRKGRARMPIWLLIAALLGLSGVALDAAGSHALAQAAAEDREAFAVATRHQMIHAVALLAVAWLAGRAPAPRLVWVAGFTFTIGVVLFSGSITLRVLAGADGLGWFTPVGGVCLMAGWAVLALYAVILLRKSGTMNDG